VARGLFAPAEIDALCAEFAALHAGGPVPGHFEPRATGTTGPADPLHAYPRVMHPHRINDLALRHLLEPRLRESSNSLLGEEVLAAQSMFYFKPPGRGARPCTRTTSICGWSRAPVWPRGSPAT
jgi:phytanoyl-CoA hydroxylase